jgi:hypothetical protein
MPPYPSIQGEDEKNITDLHLGGAVRVDTS